MTSDQPGDELFEMANLYPAETGLPMTVWVSTRGNARHDAQIKVNIVHGNQMTVDNVAIVGVRPSPRIIAGRLCSEDEHAVFGWISPNAAVIIAYWDGDIDAMQLAQTLVPISSTP